MNRTHKNACNNSGWNDTGNNIERGRLSGTVRTQKSEDLVILYGEANVIDGNFMSIILG